MEACTGTKTQQKALVVGHVTRHDNILYTAQQAAAEKPHFLQYVLESYAIYIMALVPVWAT
jgi:hypothetical protein